LSEQDPKAQGVHLVPEKATALLLRTKPSDYSSAS
jgi:hypothetical protein